MIIPAPADGGNQQSLLSEGQSSNRHVVENVNVISPGTKFLIVDFVFSLLAGSRIKIASHWTFGTFASARMKTYSPM